MRNIAIGLLASMVFCSVACLAQDDLSIEIVPYAWLAGIDGDVTVAGRDAEVDVGFDDLLDAFEIGGAFLAVTRYKRLVMWTQVDYFELDTDNLDDASSRARVQAESLFATAAVGYQFETFGPGSSLDVLGGVRYLNMENELTLGGTRSASKGQDWVDGIVMLRPSFQLSDWVTFNPTLSVGAGDSELVYELQPQFQFQLTDALVARLGYRRLYYDVGDDTRGFEGSFHGVLVGLGFIL